MKNSEKIILVVFLILFTLSADAKTKVGEEPYDKLGRTAEGEKIRVSDYRGKVVIISFWATWCKPCMKELSILSSIQKEVGVEQLQVIAVSYQESKEVFNRVSSALADNPIIFSHDRRGFYGQRYGVKSIPHMVIVGRDGKVLAVHLGYNEKKLPGLIEEINQAIRSVE